MISGPSSERASVRERASWALYDFANTIFSMNVATLYFSVWVVSDLHSNDLVYATANAAASILMVVAIPILGASTNMTGLATFSGTNAI